MIIDNFRGKYFFLSNFYREDPTFTNEHRFQGLKTENVNERLAVLMAETPQEAKKLGKKVSLRPDWEDVKDDIMYMTLRIKFADEDLQKELLDTGDAVLIEGNYWKDTYWGACSAPPYRNVKLSPQEYELQSKIWEGNNHHWYGRNELGKLLMKLREEYRAKV